MLQANAKKLDGKSVKLAIVDHGLLTRDSVPDHLKGSCVADRLPAYVTKFILTEEVIQTTDIYSTVSSDVAHDVFQARGRADYAMLREFSIDPDSIEIIEPAPTTDTELFQMLLAGLVKLTDISLNVAESTANVSDENPCLPMCLEFMDDISELIDEYRSKLIGQIASDK